MAPTPPLRWLFVPIMAGATLRDRLIACLGACLCVGATAALCALLFGVDARLPIIVAPVGASAVLVFAIPASPLAQPWPVIGGNAVSALVGVTVAHLIHDPVLAVACAAALAIAAMSVTRSLHPPGGAAALTGVIGGPAVTDLGFLYPFVPVALNMMVLVGFAIVFHRLARRAYPHVPAPPVNTHLTADAPAPLRAGFQGADVDAALARLGETFDIDRADLDRLLREVSLQAAQRTRGPLACRDIMSRDVVVVDANADVDQVRALLLRHNVRILPVVDADRRLVGTVGLRDLAMANGAVNAAPAITAAPDDPALSLLPVLTDGRSHAVVIVDGGRRILGLVTQTDLLAATAALPRP